jgi:hypothetical protein
VLPVFSYEAGRAAACVSEYPSHTLFTKAGEGVVEGRVEEGGGVRGCYYSYVSTRSFRGYQSAVCLHVDSCVDWLLTYLSLIAGFYLVGRRFGK